MNRKGMISMMVAAATALSMSAVAFAGETEAPAEVFENQGMKLSIPEEYKDLVIVTTPDDGGRELFRVCEKASVDALEKTGESYDYAGFVFGIDHVSEEEGQQFLTEDTSGMEFFAQAEDGSYYIYTHATDVPVFRESNEEMEQGMKEWQKINEWAWNNVREQFIADNEGLTAVEFGDTALDIYLARIAFGKVTNYTVSTTQFGPMEPKDVDATPFVSRLMNGVKYQYAEDGVEAPDGEYVVLNFPDDNVRFDFFSAPDGKNLIREVNTDAEMELFFEAQFEDGTSTAYDIMQEWYDALAQANGMTEAE